MKLGIVHAVFHCFVCGKSWEKQDTAMQNARRHTERTGHKTSGEVGTAYAFSNQTNPSYLKSKGGK
jgi:hypothetical protein